MADDSTTHMGYTQGIGATFEIGSATELYLEARFKRVDSPQATEYIPSALGIRFREWSEHSSVIGRS